MERREPLAMRICCLALPKKSPVMASWVAEGCFTVKAYSDMVEKLVMACKAGAGPGDATTCRGQWRVPLRHSSTAQQLYGRSCSAREGGGARTMQLERGVGAAATVRSRARSRRRYWSSIGNRINLLRHAWQRWPIGACRPTKK